MSNGRGPRPGNKFVKPTGVNQWWVSPCCAQGSTNADDPCGFCEDSRRVCAEKFSEVVNAGKVCTGNGDVKDRENVCGGSGFWCRGCGRFWAQDTCGNYDEETHLAADGAELVVKSGHVTCTCGHLLMRHSGGQDID